MMIEPARTIKPNNKRLAVFFWFDWRISVLQEAVFISSLGVNLPTLENEFQLSICSKR